MIGHMRHGSPPRLLALQLILSPNRRESLPTPSAGVHMTGGDDMEAVLERCAGLDVHQASVVCCILISVPGRRPQKLLRSFGTTTRELEAMRSWLAEHGVTHV